MSCVRVKLLQASRLGEDPGPVPELRQASVNGRQLFRLASAWPELRSGRRVGVYQALGPEQGQNMDAGIRQVIEAEAFEVLKPAGIVFANFPHGPFAQLAIALGLQGPFAPVEDLAAPALAALATALEDLEAGRCELALVGGVRLEPAEAWLMLLERDEAAGQWAWLRRAEPGVGEGWPAPPPPAPADPWLAPLPPEAGPLHGLHGGPGLLEAWALGQPQVLAAGGWVLELGLPTVGALLARRVALGPERPLLLEALSGEAWSAQEVERQARRWAAYLLAQGQPRVGVLLPNGLDFAVLYLGAALAGVCLCPYHPLTTDEGVAALARRHGVGLVLTTQARAPGLAEHLPTASVGPRGALPAGLPPALARTPCVAPEATLALIMTSGTTGGAKACALAHRQLVWSAQRTAEAFGLGPEDRYLTPLPLHHINAQVIGLLAALAGGGAVAFGARLPAEAYWAAAARVGATAASAVPALLHDLLAAPGGPEAPLRFVVTSSAPLPPALRQAFEARFQLPLLPCYGLSEAGCFVGYARPGQRVPDGAAGPAWGCEVRLSPEGELQVQGPGLFSGYDQDPEATAAVFTEDGWLRTGDLARLDGAGHLFLIGRLKELINRGGDKIPPDAVQEAVAACPGVLAACAFAVPEPRLGEAVACAVVLAEGGPDEAALEAFLVDRLGEHELPSHWLRLPELPRGPTGKVLRRELRRLWEAAQPGGG